MKQRYDVAIVGGGNAALCAALEASDAGAKVLVLEAATEHMRGGNSRHTRNVRCMHLGEVNFLAGSYTQEEFYKDLLQVTGGETNEDLARLTIAQSDGIGTWMSAHGVRWQGALRGTLQLDPQVPDSLGMIPEACRRGGRGYQRHCNLTEPSCPWRYRQHTLW